MNDTAGMKTVLEQVERIATMSGLVGEQRDEDFAMLFDLGDDRSQAVYVKPTGTFEDSTIVTFFSPAHIVAKGGMFKKGLSREAAIELLTANENMMFARFGLWTSDEEDTIVCSVDALLESMDPEEFSQFAHRVAHAADDYEAAHGGADQF